MDSLSLRRKCSLLTFHRSSKTPSDISTQMVCCLQPKGVLPTTYILLSLIICSLACLTLDQLLIELWLPTMYSVNPAEHFCFALAQFPWRQIAHFNSNLLSRKFRFESNLINCRCSEQISNASSQRVISSRASCIGQLIGHLPEQNRRFFSFSTSYYNGRTKGCAL